MGFESRGGEFIKVFNPKEKTGKTTLVISNYRWYRPYYWHIPQLDHALYDGPVKVINIANYNRTGSQISSWCKMIWEIHCAVSSSDRVVFDGFVGFFYYFMIAIGYFGGRKLILTQQNYIALSVTFRSILKYLFLYFVFKRSHTILCNIDSQKKLFGSYFGEAIGDKCRVYVPPINFEGRDDFLMPSKQVGDFVLSAGQANRDYKVLASSLQISELPTKIYAPRRIYDAQEFPSCASYHQEADTATILNLISCCKILVLPLVDSFEMSGLRVLTFGLELGKPIIVTRTQGLIEVFGEDPPFLYVDEGNAEQLASKLTSLFSDDERVVALGRRARSWAEQNLLSSDFINEVWRHEVIG